MENYKGADRRRNPQIDPPNLLDYRRRARRILVLLVVVLAFYAGIWLAGN